MYYNGVGRERHLQKQAEICIGCKEEYPEFR